MAPVWVRRGSSQHCIVCGRSRAELTVRRGPDRWRHYHVTMQLECHQLDLRYERLRVRQPARERRLLASLADTGQQSPIVVVMAETTYVVVDGHKRVGCLRRLHRDTVAAVVGT